ncbi:cell division protein ZapE [Streptomyces sp. R-07]|uniref:cell division protein ZapE n=1 Tax=Streptomyces sp. R-07 TaxID=3404052 RepID=UPI003CF74A66
MLGDFERAAERDGLVLDSAQLAVAARLAKLGQAVEREGPRRWFRRSAPEPARGVYLWGSVGRGKSWLSDTLYDLVRVEKQRVHFHEFFRQFHAAYARHRQRPGAVEHAVAELLGECRFLFFDEFHVHDAGDAMLMGRAVSGLFERGTTLLATSNYPPSRLLPNPVFHEMFQPTIALLERSLDIVEIPAGPDYRTSGTASRRRSGFSAGRYLRPGAPSAPVPPAPGEEQAVPVGSGQVRALAVRDDLVWFDFADLCDRPRSTIDYLTLADAHPRWVVSGLPRLTEAGPDAAQRFANLVDVLCDRDVHLTLMGRSTLADTLSGTGLPPDINRTASRLALLTQEPATPRAAETRTGAWAEADVPVATPLPRGGLEA